MHSAPPARGERGGVAALLRGERGGVAALLRGERGAVARCAANVAVSRRCCAANAALLHGARRTRRCRGAAVARRTRRCCAANAALLHGARRLGLVGKAKAGVESFDLDGVGSIPAIPYIAGVLGLAPRRNEH